MAIRFTLPGFGEVTVDTAEEAMEMKRLSVATEAPEKRTPSQSYAGDGLEEALLLLTTLKANKRKVSSADMGEVFQLKNPRGMGSVLKRVRVAIEAVGFANTDDAYTQERTINGREYRAGPAIDKVMAALEAHR